MGRCKSTTSAIVVVVAVVMVVVGGSVYSPQASARMVVINGQVFQEGSSLAPELKLEQIRQKTAVFSIQGQRFEVPL